FNSIDEDGHSFDQGNSPPVMAAPTREQQQRLRQFDQEIVLAQKRFDVLANKAASARHHWEKSLLASDIANHQWFPDDMLIVRLPLDERTAPTFNKSDRAHHDQYDRRKDEPEQVFASG